MGNRACPLCFARVPPSLVLCRSEHLACPACHAALEISRWSKLFASVTGLLVGFIAIGLLPAVSETAQWALQVPVASVGFGIGAAALLYFSSDLVVRLRPTEPSKPTFPHLSA
jgi:hypothetical protein